VPQQGITFAGAYIGLPGAYYADDVSAALPNTPPVTPPLLFLGYGWGPKPKTPVTFVNPGDLQVALRGGPAAAYVPFMATPSPSLNGAQRITFIDVSSNTQSSLALLTTGATTYATLTSTLYGPPSNQLTLQISTGSATGGSGSAGRKFTLVDNFAGVSLVGDNLGVPLQVAYSGASTGGVTMTVTSAAFALTSPVSGESVTVPLGSGGFNTVSLLVEFLNGTSNYFANLLSATQGQLPSNFLSSQGSTLAAPVSGVLQYQNIFAVLNDPVFWINQFASTIATAVTGSVSDTLQSLPVTGSAQFFSGATGVPPTNNDYASGLNVGLTVPAWAVFCDSNAIGVQALMAQHCITASSVPYGMWRRGFTGSSIGDTVTTTITNSRALDTIQMNYLYPGIYRINTTTNQNQLYGGLYAAAMAAGMVTGNQVAIPLTNKPLIATGVELANAGAALTTSQLVNLQNNGVMAVYMPNETGIPTILSDVTTWEVDNNPENTASQQVACRYWLAYSVVNVLQQYVGTIAAPVTEVNILNAMKNLLDALIYTGNSSNGVLTSWARKSLKLTYTGSTQTAAVTFNAILVDQNRYITAFATILPLNFTIVNTG